MTKKKLTIIVYAIGLIFVAVLGGLWDSATSLIKATITLLWTTIFLVMLFYTDKNENS